MDEGIWKCGGGDVRGLGEGGRGGSGVGDCGELDCGELDCRDVNWERRLGGGISVA